MPGGYVPSEDYDEVMDDTPASSLIQAPGAAELNRPLQQEVWYHGPVSHVSASIAFAWGTANMRLMTY